MFYDISFSSHHTVYSIFFNEMIYLIAAAQIINFPNLMSFEQWICMWVNFIICDDTDTLFVIFYLFVVTRTPSYFELVEAKTCFNHHAELIKARATQRNDASFLVTLLLKKHISCSACLLIINKIIGNVYDSRTETIDMIPFR